MAYINITLRSPVDVEIIGVLLANGKTANASLHYDPTTGLQDFVIDHSGEIKLAKNEGELICVDKNNTHWRLNDVVNYSIQRHYS